MSKTFIRIFMLPDFGGFPPSTAVSTKEWLAADSRSKAFLMTNIGVFPSSPLSLTSNLK
uniref:Uncharacterized protein n=1 Tax=Echeneis naucrates TaxID=173247 RepID=A0A665UKZ8_ECHNA